MLEVIIDNSYPSSHLYFPIYTDEEGYDWQDTPLIILNSNQIEEFSIIFNISLEEAREIIISHELGHYLAWKENLDYKNEELAWQLAPPTNLSNLITEEIKIFCLKSYS
jgi:hypothetical protein